MISSMIFWMLSNNHDEADFLSSCVDSILIQGKGSVYCPPQSELNSLIPPPVKQIAADYVTDKGYAESSTPQTYRRC